MANQERDILAKPKETGVRLSFRFKPEMLWPTLKEHLTESGLHPLAMEDPMPYTATGQGYGAEEFITILEDTVIGSVAMKAETIYNYNDPADHVLDFSGKILLDTLGEDAYPESDRAAMRDAFEGYIKNAGFAVASVARNLSDDTWAVFPEMEAFDRNGDKLFTLQWTCNMNDSRGPSMITLYWRRLRGDFVELEQQYSRDIRPFFVSLGHVVDAVYAMQGPGIYPPDRMFQLDQVR